MNPPGEGWAGQRVLVVSPTPTVPLDFGNRRRIHHVCRALHDLGAEIHLLHYPAESDWREGLPFEAQRAMQAQWASYTLVPPTRPLHPPAEGLDHRIDEWWDPAIGTTLDWLFARERFDVCIVNYAWLSRALEHCPPGVLRVLDTHDRFTGRRALLEAQGIAPEYFHTEAAEERIALDRAHVVWAIKDEEAALFRDGTRARVLTLGHVEPLAVTPRPAPSEVLRFGIIAARNSINLVNIRACIDAFVVRMAERLPPLEIVIAGGCCEALEDLRRFGFVRLLGPVGEVAEFYGAVDAVLSPIAVSTGLKIKTGEALCHGKAVLALAHAFEGYQPTHRWHALADFAGLAAAAEAVVRTPALLDELEAASLRSVGQAQACRSAGFAATLEEAGRQGRGVCILLDAAQVRPGSMVADHALEVAEALAGELPVNFHLAGTGAPEAGTQRRLRRRGRVRLSPAVAALVNDGHGAACSVAALLEEGHRAYWFTHCAALPARVEGPVLAPVFLALDALVQSAPPAAIIAFAVRVAGLAGTVRLTSRHLGPLASAVARASGAAQVAAPLFRHGAASAMPRQVSGRQVRQLLILADATDCPLAALVGDAAGRLGWPGAMVVVPEATPGAPGTVAAAYLADTLRGAGPPTLAIDVAVDPRLEALKDALDVAGTPLVRLFAGSPVAAVDRSPGQAGGLVASVLHLADVLSTWPEPWATALERRRLASRGGDAGWAAIRAEIGVVGPPA